MLNLAIVGLGSWGQALVNAVQGTSGTIRFVAGATRTRARAEAFAADRGIRLHERYEDVLADPAVQGVVLATPHLDHEGQIIAAARAGKHVFVEKPFTTSLAGAHRAVAAAHEAGVTLALGHNRRFHPNMGTLRGWLRDGRLGTICHAEATMSGGSGLSMQAGHWRADPAQSPAGAMAPQGIHLVDGLIDLLGPVASVSCQAVHRVAPAGVLDTTSVLLAFESGATGYLSCMISTGPSYRFCLYGSAGIAEIRQPGLDDLSLRPLPGGGEAEQISRPGVNTLALELEAFADAVAGRAPYQIPVDQMIHGIAVYEAIIASAQQGRPMTVAR